MQQTVSLSRIRSAAAAIARTHARAQIRARNCPRRGGQATRLTEVVERTVLDSLLIATLSSRCTELISAFSLTNLFRLPATPYRTARKLSAARYRQRQTAYEACSLHHGGV